MRPIIIIFLKPNNSSKTRAIESMILSPPNQSQVYLCMLILFLILVTVHFFQNCWFIFSSLSARNYFFLKISTTIYPYISAEPIALFIAQLHSYKALSNLFNLGTDQLNFKENIELWLFCAWLAAIPSRKLHGISPVSWIEFSTSKHLEDLWTFGLWTSEEGVIWTQLIILYNFQFFLPEPKSCLS